jgi:DNA polymerase III subunit delta'
MWKIIGQDEAVSLLREGIVKGSLAHAYLFTGQPHTGKMTLAMELAKAVNCTSNDAPCGECDSCRRIDAGKHTDVRIVNVSTGVQPGEKPKTEIGIDIFREDILPQVSLPPFEGKYRVYIFEGAENLSTEAANCFLKTLEEPLGRVLFILLATDEKSLPATVISRCQRLKLRSMPLPEIEKVLIEKYEVPPENARLISHLSHGAAGWAITAAADEMVLEENTETVNQIVTFISSGYEERFTFASSIAAQFAKRNGVTEEFLDNLTDFWRDLLLVKIEAIDAITNVDLLLELHKQANNFTIEQIRKFIGEIRAARRQLALNANPRLVLEVLMLNMPRVKAEASTKVQAPQRSWY